MKENKCINFMKGGACIFVIILHCEFPTLIGSVVNVFARFGVPFFFMVSGYFFYNPDPERINKKMPRKLLHIFKIICIYFIINIIYISIKNWCIDNQTITITLKQIFQSDQVRDLLLFNRTIIGVGGWFLPALLYGYLIMWEFNKINLYALAYKLVPFLLFFIFS